MPLKTIPLAGSKGPSSYNTSMGARVADEPEGCESASLLYLMSDRGMKLLYTVTSHAQMYAKGGGLV